MHHPQRLPFKGLVYYGFGIFGWSLSINLISVMLLYVYLPPNNAGMVNLVPQVTIFVVFNLIALVTAGGRLFDAVVDPLIANWSDRSNNPKGRRIPYMRMAAMPMAFFAVLMFIPPYPHAHGFNVFWLALVQLGYYFFFGLYVIPYNALLAELGHYPNGKMQLSTAQSVGFILGVVFSTIAPALADFIQEIWPHLPRLTAVQYAIGVVNVIGAIAMLVPAYTIDEKKYCKPATASEPVLTSLRNSLRNHNFRIFAMADAAFFFSTAIITSGLLYYVKVMLGLPEAWGTPLMACMVVVTLAMYPVVNILEKRYSKKKMMILAFAALSLVFFGIFNLGRYPVSPVMQVVALMVFFGLFDSFLGILPNTVIADISEADAKLTGQNKEGMYFGMRALFQKLGQTGGIMLFAMLTLYGKDPGHDLGLRLSGVIGGFLCLFAAFVYTRYHE